MHWSNILGVIAAGASAVAAFVAWRTSVKANLTAEAVARIEKERWHAERAPRFDIALEETGGGHARLSVHLDGPDVLGELDSVSISVGNDDMDHTLTHEFVDGPTQQQVDEFVWGPWRFTPSADGAGQNGREVDPVPLAVGRGRPFSMERTHPGWWMQGMTQAQWQRQRSRQKIRLVLSCRLGDEQWVITKQIDNPPYSED